jgi:hypothetical protein
MTNNAAACPSWCKDQADHKPGERYVNHSATVAEIGPYRVTIGRIHELDSEHVHLLDSRAWTSPSDPAHNVSRESVFMRPDEAFALAEILRRATTVQAPASRLAASAVPYAAALAELHALGEALAEGVRILDAARPDNPAPLR